MVVRKSRRAAPRHGRIVRSRGRGDSGSLPKGKDRVLFAKKSLGRTKSLPDLQAIPGRFSDVLSMVGVAYRALGERASDIEAAAVLAQGIGLRDDARAGGMVSRHGPAHSFRLTTS